MAIRRAGVLTGGGDVPGLNAAIKTLVLRLCGAGWEVVGLRRGWAALLHVRPGRDEENRRWVVPLDPASTRTIDRSGGTILHTSRLHPARVQPNQLPPDLAGRVEVGPDGTADLTARSVEAIGSLDLDALVAIGGDGTLSFARRLDHEGVRVVAIPKTMDNDVHGTDYSIGFSTAVTRAVQFIGDLRTTAGSHERILVVELFGRYSGEPCLLASYLAGSDRALIAEVPFDLDRLVQLLRQDQRANPSGYAVVTVSEGAHPVGGQPLESGEADAVGHRKLGGIGFVLAEELRRRTGARAMVQVLGYLMRSGPPDSLDQLVASNFGSLAADLLLEGRAGLMTAVVGGRYTAVSLDRIAEGVRRVDVDRFYDRDSYRPRVVGVMSLPMFLH